MGRSCPECEGRTHLDDEPTEEDLREPVSAELLNQENGV